MAILESSTERVVRELGSFAYGVMSRDQFVNMLVLTSSSGNALEIPTADATAAAAASALMNMTDGGYTTPELIAAIENRLAGTPSGDVDQTKNVLRNSIRICYEPEFSDSNSKVILRPGDMPKIAANGTSPERVQGSGGEANNPSSFSLRHVINVPGDNPINENGGAIGAAGRSLSLIQVFGSKLTPANRDMGALSLFMNAIPTIEMSRAVPFIDVVLIQQGSHLTGPDNTISSLSMGQFLLGNKNIDNVSEQSYLNANDSEIVHDNSSIHEFEAPAQNGSTSTSTPAQIATAGMELFTAPQTLVPADEVHSEYDTVDPNSASEVRRRGAPVIDRFRPLMTLKSLSFTVAPSGGMMCYKSGKMSLTLHDKSRLSEIAAFVRPARYGTTHLQIEYGWAHPSAQPQNYSPGGSASASTEQDNLFGQFIGSLRAKEKYQIVNSSFSFDDAGQVEIEMTLSMLSSRAANQVHIGLGFENTTAYRNLQNTLNMIRVVRDRLPQSTVQSLSGEGDILGSLTSPQSVMSLDEDSVRAIDRIIAVSNRPNQDPDLRELGDRLEDLIGSRRSGRNRTSPSGAVSALNTELSVIIEQKIRALRATPDPFFLPTTAAGEATPITSSTQYASFGKIMAMFVGSAVAQSNFFKDTQIIFYNMNNKASYVSNWNIACFPINIDEFEEVLKHELDQLINMTIESFMGFMSTYFLTDPGSKAYGFSGLYGERDEENFETRQLNERYRAPAPRGGSRGAAANLNEDSAALFDAQQRILRHSYGSPTGEVEFKMPTIQMVMESVPLRTASGADTVLRMHIFDSQTSSHNTLQTFLEAMGANRIGTLNAASQALVATLNQTVSSDSGGSTSSLNGLNTSEFYRQLNAAQSAGLIEPWPPTNSGGQSTPDILSPGGASRYRMRGGFGNLKRFIMRTMPSVRYGEGASGIISAKVSSMSDPSLSTVNMLRQARSPDTPTGARDRGLPLQVAPVECQLESIGCPLWNFGQQIFIDFGTGTSVDGIYGVTGVEHSIGQGEFKTSVKLTPMNSYARYESMFDQIEAAFDAIRGLDDSNSPGSSGTTS